MSFDERLGLVDPAAPGATVGRLAAPRRGEAASERLQRAVSSFNDSDAARVVAGLTRTLGAPRASIGAAAGSPSEVRITVAWDLCWYQWAVDGGDGRRPVIELGKGDELDQLDGSARQWNAHACWDGRLGLGTVAAEPLATAR